MDFRATSAGGAATTAPITIAPGQQLVSVTNGGTATATSGAACAGAPCAANQTSPTGAGGTSQSASGAADARGLVARNQVTTDATVAVRVHGQNFAPITVVIDSIAHIFNLGVAQSTSGDSTTGGSATTTGPVSGQASASSGSAQASGAVVQNQIAMSSSAQVEVHGDNYSPINIVLDLAANLVNWGIGWAKSGDAQAQDGGAGAGANDSATSGAASARGLQVFNLISMWADATVDIDGDNYAPITVDVHFRSNIDNRGLAVSQTGNVGAGGAATAAQRPAATSASTAAASSAVSSSGSNRVANNSAVGGNAVAISNSASSAITSDQIANANGGKPVTTTTITNLLRSLPSGAWNPVTERKPGAHPAARTLRTDSTLGRAMRQPSVCTAT